MTGATARYAAIHAAYWAGFCLVMAFSSVFLLSRGLGNTQIGALLAGAGLASAALQPLVARAAARSRRPLRLWIASIAGGVTLASASLMLPFTPLVTAIVFGVVVCSLQVGLPLLNALGMAAARDGHAVDFGKARAIGSYAFAATSLAVGAAVARWGTDLLPPLMVLAQVAIVVAAATFLLGTAPPPPGSESHSPSLGSPHDDLGWRFRVLLVGVVGVCVSHGAINTFLFQLTVHLGGDAGHMGLAFTLAAVCETLPMVFFRRLVMRWSPGTLLLFSALMFLIKAVATLFAPNVGVLISTMVLQVAGFGLLVPATVYYIERWLPDTQRVEGQARMTQCLTLGPVIASLGGGIVLDTVGLGPLLAAGAVVAGLGVVAVRIGVKDTR